MKKRIEKKIRSRLRKEDVLFTKRYQRYLLDNVSVPMKIFLPRRLVAAWRHCAQYIIKQPIVKIHLSSYGSTVSIKPSHYKLTKYSLGIARDPINRKTTMQPVPKFKQHDHVIPMFNV